MGNVFIQFDWPFYGRPEGGKKRVRMRAWEGVLARRPYACALTTVAMTVIVCGRQACSGSKTSRFFSPCDGDVHAVRSGVPCMPLIFTTSGSLGKAK